MKAHIPGSQKRQGIRAQRNAIRKVVKEEADQCFAKVEFCFYFLCLIALKEEFGFGETRLIRFYNKMQALMNGVNWQIDKGFEDFVVEQLIRRLKQNNIDYENILDINVIQVPDELKEEDHGVQP